MSVRIMTAAWAVDLPAGEKLVLLALADCANDEGKCWPGLANLARKTGKSRRSLIDTIHALEKGGHLSRDVLIGKGVNYSIHPTDQAELPLADAKSAPVQKQHQCKKTSKSGAKSAPKPSGTVISSEAKASSPRVRFPAAAPFGVSDEQWSAFREQRKKPLNARSYLLLCNKLTKLAEAGWPPGDMIDLAIERGWETVFAPRNQSNGTPNQSSLRGSRPDPALDLLRAARAAEAAERTDSQDHRGTRPSLPAIGCG